MSALAAQTGIWTEEAAVPAPRTEKLDELLRHPALWRSSDDENVGYQTLPTGHAALDELLPGSGWPVGALTEIVVERQGLGELALVMPALAALSRQGRNLAWVAPPYVPYAPALEQAGLELSRVLWLRSNGLEENLWAAEQALRSGVCGAVLLWLAPNQAAQINVRSLRRLQLAAEQGESMALLFWRRAVTFSPAALRLRVFNPSVTNKGMAPISNPGGAWDWSLSWPGDDLPQLDSGPWAARDLQLEILKCRGLGANKAVKLKLA